MDVPTNHEQQTGISNTENLIRIFRKMDNNQTPLDGIFRVIEALFRFLIRLIKYGFVVIILLGLFYIILEFFLLFIIRAGG